VSVDIDGDTPVVSALTRTEATIWRTHGTWPLQLRIQFIRVDGSWLASETVASTWRVTAMPRNELMSRVAEVALGFAPRAGCRNAALDSV